MVDYIVEYYAKGERKPHKRGLISLAYGEHPTHTPEELKGFITPKIKLKYASNGVLAAESYRDVNGNHRLRWKKY